jgi:hypothetical protein
MAWEDGTAFRPAGRKGVVRTSSLSSGIGRGAAVKAGGVGEAVRDGPSQKIRKASTCMAWLNGKRNFRQGMRPVIPAGCPDAAGTMRSRDWSTELAFHIHFLHARGFYGFHPIGTGAAKHYLGAMNLILIILVLLLLFGGGGFYLGGPVIGGGGLGLILLICLIVYCAGGFRTKN